MIKDRQEAIYTILNIVRNKNITYLRVDRYDGFLFDDFEISKYWKIGEQIKAADEFIDEAQNNKRDFNYSLLIVNEYGSLIYRMFETLEQIFEDPEQYINFVSEEMIDKALDKHLITFKQYNAYMKNKEEN